MSNVIKILVSFPDEFAVELTVVVHHPALLTSFVLRQAHKCRTVIIQSIYYVHYICS